MKLDFQATAYNRTDRPWTWIKFCVKAKTAAGEALRSAASECLIDLDGSDIPLKGTLTWKYSPKLNLGADKSKKLAVGDFEISFVGGGQESRGVRTFPANCDTVWPHALQVFISSGWTIKTSDRMGGVLFEDKMLGEIEARLRKQ